MGDMLGPALGVALSLGDELVLLWELLGDTDGPTLGEALGVGELVGPLVFRPRCLPFAVFSICIPSVRSYVNGLVAFSLDILLVGPLRLVVCQCPRL
jgi:hypothetical protein